MKNFKTYAVLSVLYFTVSSCVPSVADCNDTPAYVEGLISITPIQSVFQVGDTLKIECSIPARNTYFAGFDRNIFIETDDATALWNFGNGISLFEEQQLIVRKGAIDGPRFVAIYNLTCDCYEFEADLLLSEVNTYNISITNTFVFEKEDCDFFLLETTFPWINFPNVLEFEVVP